MHFTGHGVKGQLTFEDRHGQLQYVDEDNLLAMLQCRNGRDLHFSRGGANPNSGGGAAAAAAAAAARTAATRTRRNEAAMAAYGGGYEGGGYGMGNGYAHFQDVSVPLEEDGEEEKYGW
ncbi:unnamed protein product, partial [Laminaria digitata]